jgi:hypothetical protein
MQAQCCNSGRIKNVKNEPRQVRQVCAAVWIMHTNICVDRI